MPPTAGSGAHAAGQSHRRPARRCPASAAGSAIDAMNLNTIVGTLAGDDTVMIVMRDTNSAAAFCGEIKSLLS